MTSNSFILQAAKHRYQCDQCDSWFRFPSMLAKHVRFRHDASDDGDAFCPFCYRTDFHSFMTYLSHHKYCQKQMRTWIWRRVRNRSTHERAVMRAALTVPYSLDTVQRCAQGVSVAFSVCTLE